MPREPKLKEKVAATKEVKVLIKIKVMATKGAKEHITMEVKVKDTKVKEARVKGEKVRVTKEVGEAATLGNGVVATNGRAVRTTTTRIEARKVAVTDGNQRATPTRTRLMMRPWTKLVHKTGADRGMIRVGKGVRAKLKRGRGKSVKRRMKSKRWWRSTKGVHSDRKPYRKR